jgi:hypothetical protein
MCELPRIERPAQKTSQNALIVLSDSYRAVQHQCKLSMLQELIPAKTVSMKHASINRSPILADFHMISAARLVARSAD